MDTFVTTFLGRSQASRGKRQIITRVYSVWAVAFLTFHKGWVFFLKTPESASKRAPCWHPRTQHLAPDLVVHCSCQSASRDTQPRVFMTKGRFRGSPLSVHAKEPARRKQEVLETECLLMAGVIYQASARLSPDKHSWNWCQWSWNQSGLRWFPPRSVCGTKHPLRQPTATTGSHQLQYV